MLRKCYQTIYCTIGQNHKLFYKRFYKWWEASQNPSGNTSFMLTPHFQTTWKTYTWTYEWYNA